MRLLFELDAKNYDPEGERFYRYSSCGIVIRDKKVGLAYINTHGVYVIPGGGIEPGETKEQAAIREMREETGLVLIPETIKEYGYIVATRKGTHEPVYVQEDYYFLCEARDLIEEPMLTESEKLNGYSFGFESPGDILRLNTERMERGEKPCLFERDRKLLELLVEEGIV